MSYACAFTGHRKVGEDLDVEKLKEVLRDLLLDGCDRFYCGMAVGFDLLACQTLMTFRQEFDFRVIACIPCADQNKSFSIEDKMLYAEMRKRCDDEVILAERYYNGCMQSRDRYMVDRADVVVAYCNDYHSGTGYTVKYAKKKEKKMIFLVEEKT